MEDLWIWPQEAYDSVGGGTGAPTLVADATSETGSSFLVNTTTKTNQYVSASDGATFYIGSQVPAGKLRIYFKAKADSATNLTVSAKANGTGLGSTTVSVTTSYAVYAFDVDTTSYSGSQFIMNFGSATQNTYIAWVAILAGGRATFRQAVSRSAAELR